MASIEVNGKTIELDDNGNLTNPQDWDEDVARALAAVPSDANSPPSPVRRMQMRTIQDLMRSIRSIQRIRPGGGIRR